MLPMIVGATVLRLLEQIECRAATVVDGAVARQ